TGDDLETTRKAGKKYRCIRSAEAQRVESEQAHSWPFDCSPQGRRQGEMGLLAVGGALMIAFVLALSLQWLLLAAILRQVTRSR
ncbi:MAG TPA: hypothetical protein VFA54_02425, partial [Bryobacterales bacterium]|nr:hypothetical protein [Bryobacterales bacterium]